VSRVGGHIIERVSSFSSLLNKGLHVSRVGGHIIERVSSFSASIAY
jgi:hypothetical protein